MHRVALIGILTLSLLVPGPVRCASPGPPGSPGWDPARTFVFLVGVLEWQKAEDWDSFEAAGRCDETLVNLLRAGGVRRQNLVYLQDRAATLTVIRSKLRKLLKRTRPGDQLVFFYAGHGFVEDEKYFLANYDAGDTSDTWWPIAELIDTIESQFHGDRALMMVDCCYSGHLTRALDQKKRHVSYAAYTAASPDESSTGNWTFTEAVLAGLRGEATVDFDGDGFVEAGELARHVADEMRMFDSQSASSLFTGSYNAETVLARTLGPKKHPRTGERVQVQFEGDWWAGRIVDVADDQALINWVDIGYHRAQDEEWVPLESVQPYTIRRTETPDD